MSARRWSVALEARKRSVALEVRLAFVADNPGSWMIHCHIPEHQEAWSLPRPTAEVEVDG